MAACSAPPYRDPHKGQQAGPKVVAYRMPARNVTAEAEAAVAHGALKGCLLALALPPLLRPLQQH